MGKIVKLLDCTLRDGGYVNDWEFGHDVITSTYKRLESAGVEFIEVGFLDDRRIQDNNRTINPSTEAFDDIFLNVDKGTSIPIAMIDFGTCGIENIGLCENSFIDGIRIIFKKEKIGQALPFCKKIKEKGYKLFIQAVSITDYSDAEMLDYIREINEVGPDTFSIVDTYGLLDRRKLSSYFYLMDRNLNPNIAIGYHGHNNFQLAFSNSTSFLAFDTKRTLIVDSTVYGMGKSAGNCASELISLHMNEKYEKHYDINQYLEILDTDLMSIYMKNYWGYKYNYYISAMQNCHPNYVNYLLDKKTLSISEVNGLLSNIPYEYKLRYDEKIIFNLYFNYQSKMINDDHDIDRLREALTGNNILVLGLGLTLNKDATALHRFIDDKACKVISLNSKLDEYKCNFIFMSNAKRYRKLVDGNCKNLPDLILTSNINIIDLEPNYTINYESLVGYNSHKNDNSLLLCLALLIRIGVKRVYLAGVDGFTLSGDDYYEDKYHFSGNEQYRVKNNESISEGIKELSKNIECVFLTKSIYEG